MSHAPLVDTQQRRATLDHMLAAVEAIQFQDDPFPHIVVKDFFPKDVYSRLLDCLPSSEVYEPFGYEKHANENGQSNRKRFRLANECIETLPRAQQEFWFAIRSALGSVELKETIFHKLRTGLSYRFKCDPEEARSLPGYALPELFHETAGYSIKPHPDTRKKVVTMQIALPEIQSQEEAGKDGASQLGTEFYRRSVHPASWLRDPKGFEVVKTMQFLPNSAYAFVVLNTMRIKSWHGRSSLSSSCGVRNSLLNIWYRRAEQANMEIVEENISLSTLRKAA